MSCVGTLYGLHLLGIASSWIGFAQEKSAFIIPKLVLKLTTIVGLYIFTVVLLFFCLTESDYIGEIIAKGFNTEYHNAKEIVDENAAKAAGVGVALCLYQTCLFVLLWYCYRNIRDAEVTFLLQKYLKEEKRKQRTQMTTFM